MSTPNPCHAAITMDDVCSVSPALAQLTQDAIVGKLWQRPDLPARERSMVTLAALIACNQPLGLPHYVNLALEHGISPGEISEIVTHLAFYAGWPNAFSAVMAIKDIFAQGGIAFDPLSSAGFDLAAGTVAGFGE
ncbi:carboxymuconolactone decarboxylase [Pseudogulbenkiania sp. NH8B]|uniref:carboxymuconolactone decarboxylase family protein n=1 Tax=Pseudogulbenkiania sp. (strain NH8B) TaxID=748280 RepID=UPI0002279AED|nr:carboxymuconolactone decarboxylase family protein [Pseudogulbenkiania sp. NH8B]BAK77505.1 carboxymuconolactone decarboxylase [Pseudogulbenkiania sp. NH8B]